MKRTAICILIGIASTLIVYEFIKYRKSKLDYYYAKLPSYNGELKIRIGDVADDKRSVISTLGQIKKRLDVKAEQLDKNIFQLSVKDVPDSVSTKKMLVESIELRFLETYSLVELTAPLTELEKELKRRKNLVIDTSDKYAFLNEPKDNETKKKMGTILLSELIIFYTSPISNDRNGNIRYPAQLGVVKIRDTAYLNKILNEEQTKKMFPTDLFFAYENYNGDPGNRDSNLNFYAIKSPDPLYSYPTGENIEDCRQDFQPPTGNPMITMKFDEEGSDYWYQMTKRNVGKPIAMLANNVVITAPAPESAIQGGESRITGSFSLEEAMSLAAMIRSGKLELPVTILESKFKSAKKELSVFWMLGLVFLLMSLIAYGVSFAIKPASRS